MGTNLTNTGLLGKKMMQKVFLKRNCYAACMLVREIIFFKKKIFHLFSTCLCNEDTRQLTVFFSSPPVKLLWLISEYELVRMGTVIHKQHGQSHLAAVAFCIELIRILAGSQWNVGQNGSNTQPVPLSMNTDRRWQIYELLKLKEGSFTGSTRHVVALNMCGSSP